MTHRRLHTAMWGPSSSAGIGASCLQMQPLHTRMACGPLQRYAVCLGLFSIVGPTYSELGPGEIFILSRLKIWNYFMFLQCVKSSLGDNLKIWGKGREQGIRFNSK